MLPKKSLTFVYAICLLDVSSKQVMKLKYSANTKRKISFYETRFREENLEI